MVARIARHMPAARMEVPVGILDDWLDDKAAIPDAKVIALIDLIDETNEFD